jgi:RHS repeat-associated protein
MDSAKVAAQDPLTNLVIDNENVYFDLNVDAGDFVALRWKGGSNAQLCDQYWNNAQPGGPATLQTLGDGIYRRGWTLESYSSDADSCQIILSHPLAGEKRLSVKWGPNGLFVDVVLTTPLNPVPPLGGYWEPGGNNGDGNDYCSVYGADGDMLSNFRITYTGYYSQLWSGNTLGCALQDTDFDEVIGYVYDNETPIVIGTGASLDGPFADFPTGQISFQFMVTSASEFERKLSERLGSRIVSPVRSGEIVAGDSLRFAGGATGQPELGPYEYLWDFGDGRTSTRKDPGLVSFTTPGERTVSLDVVNNLGQHDPSPDIRSITVVADPDSLPDLVVTQLNVPANLAINQPTEITYSVQNKGSGDLSGKSWQDALYLSRDQYLDVGDTLLASGSVSQNVPAGGSYSNSMTVSLPTLEEGAYYLLLSVDDQWQVLERHQLNNEFTVATDVVIPQLTDGVPIASRFVADGDAHYYRIDVPEGQNLLVRLDDADNQGVNELYLGFGALPTRGIYDYKAAAGSSADQQLSAPAAAPGTWYVLAYGASAASSGDFTIEADFCGLRVTAVTPSRYGQSTATVLIVTGMGFDATTTVALVGGDDIPHVATALSVDSYTQITATFDLTALSTGMYMVRVSSPAGGSSDLASAFEVLPPGEAKLETNLIVPSSMGYHGVATIYIEYRNVGTVAMPAPLLVLTAAQNGREGAFLTLQPTGLSEGFWTSAEPEGFSHSIQILASGATPGVLQPGESYRVPVYYAGWQQPWDFSYPPYSFSLGLLPADSSITFVPVGTPVDLIVDWAALKDSVRPESISAEAWDAIWANFVAQTGDTWIDYIRMLDNNAVYLNRLGEQVTDVSQLLAFEFLQADGLSPLSILSSAVDAAMEAPGLPLTFVRTFPATISGRNALGRLGRGWSDNWEYSLQKSPDGTVTVLGPGGSRRIFQPDSRLSGTYFAQSDDYGRLIRSDVGGLFYLTESDGTAYTFDGPSGKLSYVEDTNGNRITCAYTSGLLTSLTHSSGQYLQITYNAAGRIQSVTDCVGRQTTYTYDAANEHLLSVQDYDGQVTTYSYITGQGPALEHALTETAYPGGTHRYFSYDGQGHLSRTSRDSSAEAVTFTYDAGKVITTDALGNAVKFYFDYRGLLVKTEDALGNAVSLTFDDRCNLVKVTDPAGRSYNYAYDFRGNLLLSSDPLGYVTRFSYAGALNRLASVTDARNNVTHYAYDSHGNLLSITYADGSIENWRYDWLGEATSWTNRRGNVTGYTYDASGRITCKTYADGSHVDYVYDARGNLISTTDPTGTTTYSYDANDYLTRIDYPGGQWLQFTYDTAGHRASSLDQTGHRLDYHYDTVGRLESLTDESSKLVVCYSYDAVGRISCKTLGNGIYTTYEYDAASQLLHLVNYYADGTMLSRFDYAYDSRGRHTAMNTSYGLWTYEYDDLGQLTHAVLDSTDPDIPDQDLQYVYDALGNRIRTIENGVTTEYTTNNMNQYTRVGDTTYVFDADGNLIQEIAPGGTTTYTYNDENRLVSVTKGDDTWQYIYDALGNRVATTENGLITSYVIDPIGLGNVVGEYDTSGNLIAYYDYGFGLLSRTDAAGDAACYTFDAIGSTQQLVTAAGAVANSYAYTPFGTLLQSMQTLLNPFQYVGEFGVMRDEYGLDFMRARFYVVSIGRFTTVDPVYPVSGANTYLYVLNSPLAFVDANGEWVQFVVSGIVGAIGGAITGGAVDAVTGGNVWEGVLWGGITGGIIGLFNPGFWWGIIAGELVGIFVPPDEMGDESLPSPDIPGPLRPGVDDITGWPIIYPEGPGNRGNFPGGYYYPPIPPTSATNTTQVQPVRPSDPNAKIGPAGFGPAGYIAPEGTFAYRIEFENEPSATAPVQQVVITDQLNNNLDWSTFELTDIGFGDQFIVVPPDTRHFETTVSLSYNSVDFEVHIVVDLDLATGRLTACFYSIDPDTGLPPTVDIGFLPPEDGTGRGMGHISYIINTKTDLTTGTEIRNIALISFDNQPAIATNQVNPHDPSQGTDPSKECLNTIDAGAPTSQVSALPPVAYTTNFNVTWTGTDDMNGSGIASYDIYVSDDSGPFTLWLVRTALSQSTFTGTSHHTYAFYSIARDNVGNVEPVPAIPDASVAVNVAPSADFSASPTTGNEPLTVTFTNLSASEDGIISWLWDFGDGTNSAETNPIHQYAHDGTYTVALIVTEADSDSDTETKASYITVSDTGPTADFSASPTTGNEPLTATFTDQSTSYDGIASWLWNFGDGQMGTERNPTHQYAQDGTYTISLTVIEADGSSDTESKINYITVEKAHGEGLPLWTWVLIGIGGLVVVGVALVRLRRRVFGR